MRRAPNKTRPQPVARWGLVGCDRMDRRSAGRVLVTLPDQAGAFMHSLCAFLRSSPFKPAVFLLHIAILLSAFSGLAFRQALTNSCRFWPSSFFSPACA